MSARRLSPRGLPPGPAFKSNPARPLAEMDFALAKAMHAIGEAQAATLALRGLVNLTPPPPPPPSPRWLSEAMAELDREAGEMEYASWGRA